MRIIPGVRKEIMRTTLMTTSKRDYDGCKRAVVVVAALNQPTVIAIVTTAIVAIAIATIVIVMTTMLRVLS